MHKFFSYEIRLAKVWMVSFENFTAKHTEIHFDSTGSTLKCKQTHSIYSFKQKNCLICAKFDLFIIDVVVTANCICHYKFFHHKIVKRLQC